jgi:hypothetical protein
MKEFTKQVIIAACMNEDDYTDVAKFLAQLYGIVIENKSLADLFLCDVIDGDEDDLYQQNENLQALIDICERTSLHESCVLVEALYNHVVDREAVE